MFVLLVPIVFPLPLSLSSTLPFSPLLSHSLLLAFALLPFLSFLQFCKDVWLMFDNAWFYNKETSWVYEYCTKLSEVFDSIINGAMQNLGYCCGMRVGLY